MVKFDLSDLFDYHDLFDPFDNSESFSPRLKHNITRTIPKQQFVSCICIFTHCSLQELNKGIFLISIFAERYC